MKKINHIKVACINAALFTITTFALTACGNSSKPEDTKVIAEEQNDEKLAAKTDEKDAQFLVNAAEISLEEISLGQLAQ